MISKNCSYVEFPSHIQIRYLKPCGTTLMKSVTGFNGNKTFLYPKKVYSTRSIKTAIQNS